MAVSGQVVARCGAVASVAMAPFSVGSSYVLLHPPRYERAASHLTYEALYLLQAVAQIITVLAIWPHRQPGRGWGRLGEVVAWLTVAGLGLLVIKQTLVVLTKLTTVTVAPWIAPALMAPGTISSLIGLPLVGVAVIRARIMPRWVAWVLALNLPISILGFNLLLPELPASIGSSIFPIAIALGLWTHAGTTLGNHRQSLLVH